MSLKVVLRYMFGPGACSPSLLSFMQTHPFIDKRKRPRWREGRKTGGPVGTEEEREEEGEGEDG